MDRELALVYTQLISGPFRVSRADFYRYHDVIECPDCGREHLIPVQPGEDTECSCGCEMPPRVDPEDLRLTKRRDRTADGRVNWGPVITRPTPVFGGRMSSQHTYPSLFKPYTGT